MKLRTRTGLSTKTVLAYAITSAVIISAAVFSIIGTSTPDTVMAASTGDFRSVATGNMNAAGTWETYNGAAWVAAAAAPASTDGVIEIRSGHTVTVTANVTLDQIVVDAGGALTINTSKNLSIANGTGTDLDIAGTATIFGIITANSSSSTTITGTVTLKNGGQHNMNNSSSLLIDTGGRYKREDASFSTGSGITTVNSGGVYQHNIDGQSLPQATWNTGSICEITGITSTKPGNLNQTFANFTWNSSIQNAMVNLAGALDNVQGDLTFISTGTGTLRLGQGENYNFIVGGNLYQQGGTIFASTKSQNCTIDITGNYVQTGGTFAGSDATKDNGEASPTITVNGTFNLSAGTFNMNQHTASSGSKGITTLNLLGNFIMSGGSLTETATNNGHGDIFFAKSGTQTYTKTGGTIDQTVNWTVNNNSVLDLTTNVVSSDGTFNLSSGGELMIGSGNGITATAASGNIQVTGTRTYNTGGFYTYNGGLAQVTGDGLPSQVAKLTINNSSNLSLSAKVNVSNTLTFTAGDILTGTDTLILGISTGTRGTLVRTSGYAIGNFKRWFNNATVNNIEFPIGIAGYYEGVNISYTGAPTAGGTVYATYSATYPGKSGFNIWDSPDSLVNIGYGLWSTTAGNGLTGGTFSIDITATSMPNVTDQTALHMVKRTNAAAAWTVQGTHVAGTGTTGVPIVHRTGVTSHGQFGVGSGSTNALPIKLVSFTAAFDNDEVLLNWSTSSETNNDFFTIERSKDGTQFDAISTERGAGNSTTLQRYSSVDRNPLSGYSYYRLKQTDYDGQFTYSSVVTVRSKLSNDKPPVELLSMSPNPFSDHFQLTFDVRKSSEVTFVLMNGSGQIIRQQKERKEIGVNTFDFNDIESLKAGIYFVYLIYDDQRIVQKIIKN